MPTPDSNTTPLDTLSRLRSIGDTRPILIWGAGQAGVAAARYLRDQHVEPSGFIDSKARGNWRVEGLRVHAPAEIQAMRDQGRVPFVVVASIFAAEILQSARALGLVDPADVCVLQAPPEHRAVAPGAATPDFHPLLHEMRSGALSDMPRGARTLLSAGCGGRWYFDWFEDRYGHLTRHIGTERFMPRPDDLPDNVEWLARDTASIPEVRDGEVDLVFSGQNIEHLWPDQMAGFLLEAHRVLRQDGWLVLDSPNRVITGALAYSHPEHTVEFSVSEIRHVLDLAGFGDTTVRGIWLCRDRGTVLPLSPYQTGPGDVVEILRRAALARTRPEDSFIWWAETRKRHAPRPEALARALGQMFEESWRERINRFVAFSPAFEDAEGRWAALEAGERGPVLTGPGFPLRRGRHRLSFRVRGQQGAAPCRVRMDVTRTTSEGEPVLLTTRASAGPEGGVIEAVVELQAEMTFGIRVRIFNEGGGPGGVLLDCRCESAEL